MPREEQRRVLGLLSAGGASLESETSPSFLLRPGRAECGSSWDLVQHVYGELTGLVLPDVMPPRERRSLDAVWTHDDGSFRVVEYDEVQHFNWFRDLTLTASADVPVAYDRELWQDLARNDRPLRGGGWGKPKPPLFPGDGGRHRQRAFRDFLADVVPVANGWRPTLRIAQAEVSGWLDRDEAGNRLLALVRERTDA